MSTLKTQSGGSLEPVGSEIDMPGAAFDVETELAILMEAQRLIKSNAVERIGWHTWDSWAGRMEYNEETTENWMRRILRKAMSNVLPNVRGQAGRGKRVQNATERRTRPCLHRACWAVSFHAPNFKGNKGKHAATTTAETTALIASAIVPAKMNAARTVTSRRKLRTEEYIIQGSGTKRSQMGDCKTSRVRPGNESTPRNAYHPTANSAITQQEMQRTPTAAVRSQRNALMMTPNAPHQL
jgi:hypothetical protein